MCFCFERFRDLKVERDRKKMKREREREREKHRQREPFHFIPMIPDYKRNREEEKERESPYHKMHTCIIQWIKKKKTLSLDNFKAFDIPRTPTLR